MARNLGWRLLRNAAGDLPESLRPPAATHRAAVQPGDEESWDSERAEMIREENTVVLCSDF
jgi:hypothetical protein